MLSIVLPTFNEASNGILENILKLLSQLPKSKFEVIVVDSFSTDGTSQLIKKFDVTLLQVKTTSRAVRLNKGIEASNGEMILLHHPRSILTIKGLEYLYTNHLNYKWGVFKHVFSEKHPLLYTTSWWSNYIRGKLRGIFYLDHCIFINSLLLKQIGLVPVVDIFEDTMLTEKLRKRANPVLLPFYSTTLAIRFIKNGVWRQALLNQKLKLMYYLGKNHQKMNREYERGLDLNSQYRNEDERH